MFKHGSATVVATSAARHPASLWHWSTTNFAKSSFALDITSLVIKSSLRHMFRVGLQGGILVNLGRILTLNATSPADITNGFSTKLRGVIHWVMERAKCSFGACHQRYDDREWPEQATYIGMLWVYWEVKWSRLLFSSGFVPSFVD